MAEDMAASTAAFLEDLKNQWMALVDATSDPVALLDPNLKIVRHNRAYWDLAQGKGEKSIRELAGQVCYQTFGGRNSPCPGCPLGAATQPPPAGETLRWQSQELCPQTAFDIEVKTTGEGLILVHYRNVTDFRRIQEELARSERLASLGRLSSGVAHELNTPLAGILAFAQMALAEMDPLDPHRDDMVNIEDGARRCKVIVEDMLSLARSEAPSQWTQEDVVDVVRRTLRFSAPMLRKNQVQVQDNLPHAPIMVKSQRGRLQQVFLNLVTNAGYAMKNGGGVLTVEAQTKGNKVVLAFTDTGEGMAQEVAARVFEPFFTTKPVGQGTGLGLSICYRIVQEHGGAMTLDTQPGVGTTFAVELPVSP